MPHVLTQQQIDRYHADGYLIVEGVLDDVMRQRMKNSLAGLVEKSRGVAEHDDVYDLEPGHSSIEPRVRRIKKPPVTDNCTVTDTLAMAKDLHPGKRNNLDALCDRYQIDNSARTVHGALLDAELLSDVYIAMTRGQDSLAIGLDAGLGIALVNVVLAERPEKLKVLRANQDEEKRHVDHVAAINGASGGRAVWLAVESDASA